MNVSYQLKILFKPNQIANKNIICFVLIIIITVHIEFLTVVTAVAAPVVAPATAPAVT